MDTNFNEVNHDLKKKKQTLCYFFLYQKKLKYLITNKHIIKIIYTFELTTMSNDLFSFWKEVVEDSINLLHLEDSFPEDTDIFKLFQEFTNLINEFTIKLQQIKSELNKDKNFAVRQDLEKDFEKIRIALGKFKAPLYNEQSLYDEDYVITVIIKDFEILMEKCYQDFITAYRKN